MYKDSIAKEISKLYEAAPVGTYEYHLENYDQQDVADTVNYLHNDNPLLIQDCPSDYSNKAHIVITKESL